MSRTPTTFAGLDRINQVQSFCGRITRNQWIVVGFVTLSLLSASLLITVIVQARQRSSEKSSPQTTTSPPMPPITTSSSNQTNVEYCLNRGCLYAAAHQLRWMDSNAWANRCSDFYQYACGTWQRTHPIQSFDVERTIIGDLLDRRNWDIERLLDAPIIRNAPTSWEWKLKTYYVECLDDFARLPNTGQAMVDLISNPDTINGWFLYNNSAPDASQETLLINQTVYEQIAHIYGDLGANAIFNVRVRVDEDDPRIKRLEFSPNGLTMDVNDYVNQDATSKMRQDAYKTYLKNVLRLIAKDAGVNDGNLEDRIDTVAEDVTGLETYIASSRKSTQNNNEAPMLMTLYEMSSRYSFDFREFMAHILDDPSIVSGQTVVYVVNPKYFEEIFKYLNDNSDPLFARVIHNYMRWRLVQTYIEDLSYIYIHEYRVFMEKYYGYTLHEGNDEYCTREVIRRFPLAIQRLYTRNSTSYPDAAQTIETMIDALKDGFRQYINLQATWIADNQTRTIAQQKIDVLTAAIGYTSIAFDDGLLDEYYERFAVDVNSHFENAYGYHRFYAWTISNALVKPDQLDHWDLFESRPNRLFEYLPIFNRLFVVSSAMHEPLVHPEWPWSMNIGSLGVLLAQKLFASIDGPDGRIHAPDGTRIPDWWSTTTAQAYNTSRQCITNYYVQDVQTLSYMINGVPVLVRLSGEPFSPTTLRHIAALRLAYNTLSITGQSPNFRLPGTDFTNEQTFFLAYAQTQCYQRQDLLQLVRTQLGAYDEKTALNAALIQMPEFANAFQCTPKANPCF